MANLDLRTRDAMLKGGDKGPALVPGKADDSLLYMRVTGHSTPRMPMAPLPALSDSDMLALKTWIDQGAAWGDETLRVDTQAPGDKANASYLEYKERVITDEMRQWWAFKNQSGTRRPWLVTRDGRRTRLIVCQVRDGRQRADAAPQADRITLIRRVYLDLTGLLPMPEQVDAFVNDPSPKAYEELVERLLASNHYASAGDASGLMWFATPTVRV